MIPANYTNISFPSLGIEVNPPRILQLGPFTIHYYGLIIAIGLMLAVVYACKRSKEFGYTVDLLMGWQDEGRSRPAWTRTLFDRVFGG